MAWMVDQLRIQCSLGQFLGQRLEDAVSIDQAFRFLKVSQELVQQLVSDGDCVLLMVSPVCSDSVAHEPVTQKFGTPSYLEKKRSQGHLQKVRFWSLNSTQNQQNLTKAPP